MAAAVLHTLVARMGDQNAVVVSQKTLAALIGVTDRTIRNAIQVLVAENWVQVVRLNGPGTVSAYVVNSAVAWGQPRDQLHLAAFTAAVIADAADQEAITLEHRDLRKIPMLYPGAPASDWPRRRSTEPARHRGNGAGSSEPTGRAGEARPATTTGGMTP